METVLAAFVVVFVILFAVLSLSYVAVSSQDLLHVAQSQTDARLSEQAHTALQFVGARTMDNRTLIELTLRNTGSTRLADFDRWDVIVRSASESASVAQIEYLKPDAALSVGADYETVRAALTRASWTASLFADAASRMTEFAEPSILNAGEEMILWARPAQVIEPGSAVEISVATEHGPGIFASFRANVPPVLVNSSLVIGRTQETVVLGPQHLLATDNDPDDELSYTVTETGLLEGTLSALTFSQAAIDAGLIAYSRTLDMGSGSFVFSLTDGKDTLTGQVFTVTVNEPPVYTPETTTVTLNDGEAIPVACMNTTDPDDEPGTITFTLTALPVSSTLSLAGSPLAAGSSFTLADVIAGRVVFHRPGSDLDSFTFTIRDAYNSSSEAYTVQVLAPQG
jgi:archaellum component FlaF (FlaF/FlaG flagellin family)